MFIPEEKEKWRMIESYDNYAISSYGRVRNLNTGKVLKHQHSVRAGEYPFINLYRCGHRKNINVHSLVAKAFLGKRPPGMVVHHKNNDRDNPNVENLEYVTELENARMRITSCQSQCGSFPQRK